MIQETNVLQSWMISCMGNIRSFVAKLVKGEICTAMFRRFEEMHTHIVITIRWDLRWFVLKTEDDSRIS